MALAPRGNSRSTVSQAAGKKAQRARNKASGGGSRSGSSGAALSVSGMPKRTWEEVEDEVVHVCDIAAKISHSQVGASGFLVSTLNSPLEYAHDLLDAHIKARDGLCYIRIYHVPIESYLGSTAGGDGDTDADLAGMSLADIAGTMFELADGEDD
jgi:hypothetical protein